MNWVRMEGGFIHSNSHLCSEVIKPIKKHVFLWYKTCCYSGNAHSVGVTRGAMPAELERQEVRVTTWGQGHDGSIAEASRLSFPPLLCIRITRILSSELSRIEFFSLVERKYLCFVFFLKKKNLTSVSSTIFPFWIRLGAHYVLKYRTNYIFLDNYLKWLGLWYPWLARNLGGIMNFRYDNWKLIFLLKMMNGTFSPFSFFYFSF